jgi:hypothetical protein
MDREHGRFDLSALKTPPTREQAADYINEILGELIPMAEASELPLVVAHLLGMAKLEAGNLLREFRRRGAPKRE